MKIAVLNMHTEVEELIVRAADINVLIVTQDSHGEMKGNLKKFFFTI